MLGCKPASCCLMALCAARMFSEIAEDELHTWMPVNTVGTTLILVYVTYFIKFTYSKVKHQSSKTKVAGNFINDHGSPEREKSVSAAMLNLQYSEFQML